MEGLIEKAQTVVQNTVPFNISGRVCEANGILIEGTGPNLPIGSQVSIMTNTGEFLAEIVGFKNDRVLCMPYQEMQGIKPGAEIVATDSAEVLISNDLLGRVVDAMGNPIDGKPLGKTGSPRPLYCEPPNPVTRTRISAPFDVGVKAINTMLTIGEGQRVGIMAGSGVGKSTLLGMIARHSDTDINVIALVGERGREVREFIERDLGEEGLKRSVLVVATGNESALMRIRAAFYATAIAEHFRDQGRKVVLMLDSVTRFAMAQREVGLSIGEPPSTRGYTPSVFSLLPKLLERAGTSESEGSITGIYTVLVEGDDMNEPIADATRGILDGHIVLSRRLAGKGHFPAIEILESTSRVMADIVQPELIELASHTREMIATYQETEDLITIGAYKPGQNTQVDRAVSVNQDLTAFLRQHTEEKTSLEDSWQQLIDVFDKAVQQEQLAAEGVGSLTEEAST